MADDWCRIRPAEPRDEPCLVSMWLQGFKYAKSLEDTKYAGANVESSPAFRSYWQTHKPIVEALVASSDVRVLCDPERAYYHPGQPAIIWGWVATQGDTVLWASVKWSAVKAGLAADIVQALLGDRLNRKQHTVFELVDMAKLHLVPKMWRIDESWLPFMRELSERASELGPVASLVLEAARTEAA